MVHFYALIEGPADILVDVEILVQDSIWYRRLQVVQSSLTLVKPYVDELVAKVPKTSLDLFFLSVVIAFLSLFDVTVPVLLFSLLSFGLLFAGALLLIKLIFQVVQAGLCENFGPRSNIVILLKGRDQSVIQVE